MEQTVRCRGTNSELYPKRPEKSWFFKSMSQRVLFIRNCCVENLFFIVEVHIFADLLNLTQGYLGGDRPVLYHDICANKVPLIQVIKSRYLLKYLSYGFQFYFSVKCLGLHSSVCFCFMALNL